MLRLQKSQHIRQRIDRGFCRCLIGCQLTFNSCDGSRAQQQIGVPSRVGVKANRLRVRRRKQAHIEPAVCLCIRGQCHRPLSSGGCKVNRPRCVQVRVFLFHQCRKARFQITPAAGDMKLRFAGVNVIPKMAQHASRRLEGARAPIDC